MCQCRQWGVDTQCNNGAVHFDHKARATSKAAVCFPLLKTGTTNKLCFFCVQICARFFSIFFSIFNSFLYFGPNANQSETRSRLLNTQRCVNKSLSVTTAKKAGHSISTNKSLSVTTAKKAGHNISTNKSPSVTTAKIAGHNAL